MMAIQLRWIQLYQFINNNRCQLKGKNAWQHSSKQLSTLKRLEKKPYFARVDFEEVGEKPETIYIGLGSFADRDDHFLIYDWRAPISSIYYDGKLGKVTYHAPNGEQEVNMTKNVNL